jgi:hypothetical protein
MVIETIHVFDILSPKTVFSWEEKFDRIFDGEDNALFVSKDKFRSEGDNDIKDFNYRYAIECFKWWNNGKCVWYYSLKFVVCPESLDKTYLETVCDCCGVNENEVEIQDIISRGGGDVSFGTETTEGEKMNYDVLTNIANVFETMNAMRGFYLDRNINPELDGWDMVRYCVEGENVFKKMK